MQIRKLGQTGSEDDGEQHLPVLGHYYTASPVETQDRGWRLIQRRLPGFTGGWNPKHEGPWVGDSDRVRQTVSSCPPRAASRPQAPSRAPAPARDPR